jgi:hypothetical protein
VVATGAVNPAAFATGAVTTMPATLIAPIMPSRNCRNCSLMRFPFFGIAGITGLLPPTIRWCRSSIAGSFADDVRMTAIQSARKRIRANFGRRKILCRGMTAEILCHGMTTRVRCTRSRDCSRVFF